MRRAFEAMFDSALTRILNNWLHDVGTGLWAACLLVIRVLDTKIDALAGPAGAALLDVQRLIFWLMVAALADIAVTGAFRLLYWRRETPAEEMPSKRPALIGKHVLFLVVYGGGTVWALSMISVL